MEWNDARAQVCEEAIEILNKTRDGEDLDPNHLYLTQCAVNDILTDEGFRMFQDLLQQVRAGYKKPWLFGIENLTINHAGYVFWKGHEVEHFTFYTEQSTARLEEWSRKLVKRCEFLESHGIPVNTGNVVWSWDRIIEELKVC